MALPVRWLCFAPVMALEAVRKPILGWGVGAVEKSAMAERAVAQGGYALRPIAPLGVVHRLPATKHKLSIARRKDPCPS